MEDLVHLEHLQDSRYKSPTFCTFASHFGSSVFDRAPSRKKTLTTTKPWRLASRGGTANSRCESGTRQPRFSKQQGELPQPPQWPSIRTETLLSRQGMKKGFKTAVESRKAVMFNDRENEILRQARRACSSQLCIQLRNITRWHLGGGFTASGRGQHNQKRNE